MYRVTCLVSNLRFSIFLTQQLVKYGDHEQSFIAIDNLTASKI